MNYRNNELYHYGVLGMKWGHHKASQRMAIRKTAKRIRKEKGANEANAYKSRQNTRLNRQEMQQYGSKGKAVGVRVGKAFLAKVGSNLAIKYSMRNRSATAFVASVGLTGLSYYELAEAVSVGITDKN